ncbi:mitochondrial 54S ribosomal protein mL40 NDAI_0H01100 [Naumovozyma dairenensis CBS 421]|uniref:Large ribosomal subunit protein mL40 n=1 Tax=Naumovozyma dairenensis (strain ATCC 10597 / BCRC 20456 / CBS 421 / NBRC 0211 / NRRL Y-12639) TaxID=1071378 RepID=G0WES3_NAUDC|nr:hypothetical protein NDAI_0H01100 [Naumovozyma dairenensis CBS 421]CCD26284.1 hypothetical protein NDAI_0H01100 [Naumovozyma dairenensis CBS 421]
MNNRQTIRSLIQQSRSWTSSPSSYSYSYIHNGATIQFIRNKRTTSAASSSSLKKMGRNSAESLSPPLQRAVTQLSVLSARKKMPRLLKLSNEDLIKHQTIEKAWMLYKKDKAIERSMRLQRQYESIQDALDTLESINPHLYKLATSTNGEGNGRFPLEFRLPTDAPPNSEKLWPQQFSSTNLQK